MNRKEKILRTVRFISLFCSGLISNNDFLVELDRNCPEDLRDEMLQTVQSALALK
jgi:hypothetical protein